MRGRKPKPAARKAAEGDTRKVGSRKFAAQIAGEVKASPGLPECPRHLRGRAREAWRFWSGELMAMNIDRRPDAQMLEGASVAYEAAVAAYETIHKQGRLIAKREMNPKTGQFVVVDVRAHPAVAMGNDAWKLLRSFCSEFGLSPVSRTRLGTDHTGGYKDELEELLSDPVNSASNEEFIQ